MTTEALIDVHPTRERLRHARHSVESPAIDRKQDRRAWRIVSLVETLFRGDRISEPSYRAFKRFETDWQHARFVPSRVCRYGASSGSTPAHQMAEDAMDGAEMQAERRLFAAEKALAAQAAVGGQPLQALMMLVADDDMTIEEIGRCLSGYGGKMQAQAAGLTYIRIALDRLQQHYEPG